MENKNVLVCVTGQLSCERLILAGAQLAQKCGGMLYVLHVTGKNRKVLGYANEGEALEYLLDVSVRNGADMVVVRSEDVLGTITERAKELEIAALVAGRAANYSGWDLLDDLKTRIPEVEFVIL